MKFFVDLGGNPTISVEPKINMAVLENFYNAHKLYEKFNLEIPGKGLLTVRFAKPLEYKISENGQGTVDSFTLEVITQP